MLMITALIQPFRLGPVERELLLAGLVEHTVGICAGYGTDPELVEGNLTRSDVPEVFPKLKIEIPVPEDRREEAIEALIRGARLGRSGDGKIFVSELEDVIDLGTGLHEDDVNFGALHPPVAAE